MVLTSGASGATTITPKGPVAASRSAPASAMEVSGKVRWRGTRSKVAPPSWLIAMRPPWSASTTSP